MPSVRRGHRGRFPGRPLAHRERAEGPRAGGNPPLAGRAARHHAAAPGRQLLRRDFPDAAPERQHPHDLQETGLSRPARAAVGRAVRRLVHHIANVVLMIDGYIKSDNKSEKNLKAKKTD